MNNSTDVQGMHPHFDQKRAEALYDAYWQYLSEANVVDLQRVRADMMTWRRGSAQMVLKINEGLNNISIYSVLVAGVAGSEALFRHLLTYNVLQRRESLGLVEKNNKLYVVLKYTMELELVNAEVLQRHVYALQEVADKLDTELMEQFGGSLHFEDWDRLDQSGVDNLLTNLFG
ncbi:MAG: hypothetical protein HY342_11700 [Candidatus Lambdaproteobacteria bacterium]|nr:hypothetical protein [Candidatus Lambdaproteobacteria bacterium]